MKYSIVFAALCALAAAAPVALNENSATPGDGTTGQLLGLLGIVVSDLTQVVGVEIGNGFVGGELADAEAGNVEAEVESGSED